MGEIVIVLICSTTLSIVRHHFALDVAIEREKNEIYDSQSFSPFKQQARYLSVRKLALQALLSLSCQSLRLLRWR
jgi:hypothetical protein